MTSDYIFTSDTDYTSPSRSTTKSPKNSGCSLEKLQMLLICVFSFLEQISGITEILYANKNLHIDAQSLPCESYAEKTSASSKKKKQ